MHLTKEQNLKVSGSDETNHSNGRNASLGDAVPRLLGFIALMPIPVNKLPLGLSVSPNPSLVMAPESALGLLPSRALPFAPAASSVRSKTCSRVR